MMRILTILLLPLLFIATSCDSGGEGSACSIDPQGKWRFEEFNIMEFSDGCQCFDAEGAELACAQVGLKEYLEDALECANIRFAGELIFSFCETKDAEGVCVLDEGVEQACYCLVNPEEEVCLPEDDNNRGQCDCQISYPRPNNDCTDNIIENPATGMVFSFTNSVLTGGTDEQSIQPFLEKYILWDDWQDKVTGSNCTVQTEIQFVK